MALDASRIWIKDPASTLTVGLWWQDVIARGDTLSAVAWTVPTGLTKESEGISAADMTDSGQVYPSGQVALARISGGTAGADYTIVCRVTTAAGDVDERSISVAVRER
jgi:hypothetical protein